MNHSTKIKYIRFSAGANWHDIREFKRHIPQDLTSLSSLIPKGLTVAFLYINSLIAVICKNDNG